MKDSPFVLGFSFVLGFGGKREGGGRRGDLQGVGILWNSVCTLYYFARP